RPRERADVVGRRARAAVDVDGWRVFGGARSEQGGAGCGAVVGRAEAGEPALRRFVGAREVGDLRGAGGVRLDWVDEVGDRVVGDDDAREQLAPNGDAVVVVTFGGDGVVANRYARVRKDLVGKTSGTVERQGLKNSVLDEVVREVDVEGGLVRCLPAISQ